MGCCERVKRENLREDVIKERRRAKEPQEAAARVFPPSLPWTQDVLPMISTPLYVHMGVRTYTSLVYSVHTLCTVHSILGTTQSTLSTMNTRQSPNDFDDAVHRLCTVEGGGGGAGSKLKSSVSSHPPTRGRTSLSVHSLHRKEGSTSSYCTAAHWS